MEEVKKQSLNDLVVISSVIKQILVEKNGEIDEETELMILETSNKLQNKADTYKFVIDDMTSESEVWKKRSDEFLRISKSFKTCVERMKGSLEFACKALDTTELQGSDYYWKLQSSKPSIVIEDETKVPGKYKEIVQTININKDLILADLKAGIVIDGIKLEQNQHIRCYLKGVKK